MLADRDEIVRGFFHRINRILSRKNQIFDIDTIFYSPTMLKKSLKIRSSRSMEKSPKDPLPAWGTTTCCTTTDPVVMRRGLDVFWLI